MPQVLVIPDWLLLLLPVATATLFWLKALTSLALNVAWNNNAMGKCMFITVSWALSAAINSLTSDVALLSGSSLFDPLLFLLFFGTLFLFLYLGYVSLQCLLG